MADNKKSKTSNTEVIAAFGAVVFIFSLVGVLNLGQTVEKFSPFGGMLQTNDEPIAVLDGGDAYVVVASVSGSVEAVAQSSSGTSLSSGSSTFLVDGGAQPSGDYVSPEVAAMVTEVATAEVG